MPRTRKTSARRRAKTAGGNAFPADQPKREVVTSDLDVFRRTFWWLDRNRIELAPPVSAGALMVTSAMFYAGGTPALGLVAGGAVAGCVWGLAHKALDREVEVRYARVVGTAAAVWTAGASIVGPLDPVALWSWIAGSAAAAVPWYRHKLARPAANSELTETWKERWASIRDTVGWPGSEVAEAEGSDDYAEITIQLAKGVQTYKDVKGDAEKIAGAWGLPSKAVKIRDRRKVDASTVTLVYTRVSTIDGLIDWAGVAALAPTTLSKPAVIGRNESGDWKTVGLRGHWMLVGMSRAGKSNWLHTLLALITGTYDPAKNDPAEAVVMFVDLKGGAVGGRWIDCIDWLATTIEEAILLFEDINGMIDARGASASVGEGDGDQIDPSPECPAVYVVFDECAEGLGNTPGSDTQYLKTKLTGLVESVARRGAAMGFYLVLSGQDGSLETYGTEKLRGNLMKRLCFRVARADNAQYVLDHYPDLEVKTLEDGQFYYHERADDPTPIRGPYMTPEGNRQLPQQISKRNAERRPAVDAATLAGAKHYATRHDRLPAKYRNQIIAGSIVPEARQETQMSQQTPATPPPGSPAARAAAVEAEAGVGTAPPVTPEDLARARELGGGDLARELADQLGAFAYMLAAAAGGPGVKAAHMLSTLGIKKTWMYDRLGVLRAAELIEQPAEGYYRARPGVTAEDIRGEIAQWEAGRRQLATAGV